MRMELYLGKIGEKEIINVILSERQPPGCLHLFNKLLSSNPTAYFYLSTAELYIVLDREPSNADKEKDEYKS